MLKHILVPMDNSDQARDAARFAVMLGDPTKARVTLLHIHKLTGTEAMGMHRMNREEFDDNLRHLGEHYFQAAHLLKTDCEVVDVVRLGGEHTEIVQFARENMVDLIVMGRRGVAPKKSLSEKVMAEAPCPVTVVTAKARAQKA